jgi:hypothetical protein
MVEEENTHYRTIYYSAEEAKVIVLKNKEMMDAKSRENTAARNGIEDIKEAKELGMTIDEYMTMIG